MNSDFYEHYAKHCSSVLKKAGWDVHKALMREMFSMIAEGSGAFNRSIAAWNKLFRVS